MSKSPFKAYDVRGLVPEQVNIPFVYRFGQAVAQHLGARTAVIGHDMRLDSKAFAEAVAQGLMDSGVDAIPVGQCGTEEVYFHTDRSGADAGIMITASHNPKDYNGIKIVLKGARAAGPDVFAPLERLITGSARLETVEHAFRGSMRPVADRSAYVQRLLDRVENMQLKPLKIVCHAGNGCAGAIIDLLEPHLPFEFIKIDHHADGALPNGVPNPLLPEKRQKAAAAVRAHGADFGIAWDGDFDRCFFYDHTGAFVEGYYLVGLIAQTILRSSPGAKIIYDSRLTWNTIEMVTEAGGVPVVSKAGHTFFKHAMRAERAAYGGEMSAHHYFSDFACCDSGMLPWLAIAGELSCGDRTLKAMVESRIAKFPCSGEINFSVADPARVLEHLTHKYAPDALNVDHVDGIGIEYRNWRFNARASNTEPLLRINIESRGDRALVASKVTELTAMIEAV